MRSVDHTSQTIQVLVQIEAGSRERHLYHEDTLEYRGTKTMSLPFPYPYGFVIGTHASDGECVDCYIVTRDRLQARSIVDCEPVGLLEQYEAGEVDHKVLAVPPGQEVELSPELLEELRGFVYALVAPFPEVQFRIENILPRAAALDHIQKSRGEAS